jgi:hypothetical protein
VNFPPKSAILPLCASLGKDRRSELPPPPHWTPEGPNSQQFG